MKTVVTLFCTFVLISYTGYASGSALTIAEMVYSDSLETRTRFQVFNDRLEKTVELLIDGVMPRLSPDKRRIAYAGGNPPVPRLALVDQSGNHLTYPPFFLEKHIRGWEIAGLEWSPDSRQIALVVSGPRFTPDGHPVRLLVYDLETNHYDECYRSTAQLSEGAYFLVAVKWFPDNRRILVQDNLKSGKEKVVIIDSATRSQDPVYDGITVSSSLIHNGEDILIVAHEGSRRISFGGDMTDVKHTITMFNVDKKQSYEIAHLSIPLHHLSRHVIGMKNSDNLILPGSASNSSTLTLVNSQNREVETVKLDGDRFFPQAVSPHDPHRLCGLTETGFALFDMNTRETQPIGSYSSHAPTGEGSWGAMLFLNRIDWLE